MAHRPVQCRYGFDVRNWCAPAVTLELDFHPSAMGRGSKLAISCGLGGKKFHLQEIRIPGSSHIEMWDLN